MGRPSNEMLIDKIGKLSHKYATLARDPEWSGQVDVLTRQAALLELPEVAESARWVLVVRFHASRRPFETPKRALGTRAPEVLLRARWDSDTAVFVLSGDPAQFFMRITPILKNSGLVTSMSYVTYSGHLASDVQRATAAFVSVVQNQE